MNVSVSGLKMAVRQVFWNHGLSVKEENLEKAVRMMGLRGPLLAEQIGGDTEASQSKSGKQYGLQLVDLHNKEAVERRLREVNPAAFADEAESELHTAPTHGGIE